MNWKSFLTLLFIYTLWHGAASAQSFTVFLVGSPDTTGLSSAELNSLERSVSLTLPSVSSGSDTLIVQIGPSSGNYDLLTRRFPLNQTGTFSDGCSLNFSSGAQVGLGSFTGLSTFYVRTYLASSGVGSAITVDNE
ncbi:MAG: hypothetical protein GC178_15780 [Flavobacteriales bacterium]|nr:hypothetical protein [Flavobacteriales bacterium]